MQDPESDLSSSQPMRKRRKVAVAGDKQPQKDEEPAQQSSTNEGAAAPSNDDDCFSVSSSSSSNSASSQDDTTSEEHAPQPRNTHLQHINDSTFYQYRVLLRPLTVVLSLCRGVPPSTIQHLLHNQNDQLNIRLPELKAVILCMSLLGSKLKQDDCEPLLALNQRMIRDPRQPPVILFPASPVSIQRKIKDSKGALPVKRLTLRTYWNKVNRILCALGHPSIPSEWRSEVGIFLDQLRLSKDAPVELDVGAAGGSSSATMISQDGKLSPCPSLQPHSSKAKKKATVTTTRAPRHHGTSMAEHLQPVTIEQSIEQLRDPAQAYRSAVAAHCPSCDLKCNDYVQLLFHWVSQSCTKKASPNSSPGSRKVWCAFCRCFLPSDTVSPAILTQHHAECTYEWGIKSGFISAILADASLSKKDKTRPKKHSGVFRDAPHSEYFRPCAITVPNFFALRAKQTTISYSNTDNVIWYFCPDCIAGGSSDGRGRGGHVRGQKNPPTASSLKKTFAIFRTPNALAQHYQSHLTQGGGQLGERRLPLCQKYTDNDDEGCDGSQGWNCTYPACLFGARSIAQRVNHLSKEHMVPLIVDRNGVAQRQGQVSESEDVSFWSADCANQAGVSADGDGDDHGGMYLTRGKTDMQRGHRLLKTSGMAQEREGASEDDP